MIDYYEVEAENENRLYRYDINKTRPRHAHKYPKYKIVTVRRWLYLSNTLQNI